MMLRLDNLYKRYNGTPAVDGLSLDVRPGEIFGLLGPNGAGKSTTVHLAVGLLQPDQGAVELAGHGSPKSPDVRALIGVAPQALALYDYLTVEENVRFFGRIQRLSGARLAERTRQALEFVGLKDRSGKLVHTLSGGMKRRLNLAVALVHEPALVLLDEPTVGVDPQSRNSIFENILELRRLGRTIVYTTHYMEEAERLCDRVAIMDHGKLLALDTVSGLLEHNAGSPTLVIEIDGRETRIATDDPLAELNRLSETSRVQRFRLERPNLEQVFLNLTGRKLRD